jgi:D-alanine-D-alanine ligase-like ATP-grasp enzyme
MNVVFVAPYAMETTLRFARKTAELPGVRMGVISQEPGEVLMRELGGRMAAFERVGNALDVDELQRAVRNIASHFGGKIERLLGVLEQLQEPLALVRERLTIRGMDLNEAANFRDKARMKDALRASGVPCARHRLCRTHEEAFAFAREVLPLVVKPPAGAGARNTQRIDSVEQLAAWLGSFPPTNEEPLLLEEFVQGKEHSFDSVMLHGKLLWSSISEYTPGPLEVMENPWIQWCVVLPRHVDGDGFDPIRREGERALRALGMFTGLSHMEWFRRADGSIAISEVGARPPGAQFTTLLSFAHDFDLYRAWSELMVHERFEPPERNWSVGAVFLRGQGGQRVRAVHGVEQAQRELGELVVQARIPRAGQPKSESYEGEGYVIVRHQETEVVKRTLNRVLELIRVEMG